MSVTIEPKLEINVPLLRKTLEHIEAHPEEHDQDNWARRNLSTACGTAFCVAGHAIQFAGHQVDWSDDEVNNVAYYTTDGQEIEGVARRELGLRFDQAESLFHHLRTRKEIWYLANYFTGGDIKVPDKYL